MGKGKGTSHYEPGKSPGSWSVLMEFCRPVNLAENHNTGDNRIISIEVYER
jgi:hypothetical protein